MSTARPNRRRLRGCAAAFVAGLVVVALAPLAEALPTETTPPTPTTCASGLTPASGDPTAPDAGAADAPEAEPQRHHPGRRQHRADGLRRRAADAVPRPVVAAANVVGGPELAAGGVIVDKPDSVPAPPEGTEVSYLIADMDTGQVLAAKNPHAWLLPASTLKTLTSLVVMPAVPATTSLVATDDEVNADGTRVGMVSGATYTVDDLFHGLVLMSGNDTAYALADAYGGRDKTIAAMNAKAAQLGAWDTVAVDPSGLDAPGQHSSAYDLALLGRAVMELPAYRQVAATKTYTFPGGTDRSGKASAAFEIQNHNQLLENYAGTIGIKNGYTTGARNTFVGAVTRGGRTLLIYPDGRYGHADLAASGRPARLGLRQRGAASAGRRPRGTRRGPAARARRHPGPDHRRNTGPVGRDPRSPDPPGPRRCPRSWPPSRPAPVATRDPGCWRRPGRWRGTRWCGWSSWS